MKLLFLFCSGFSFSSHFWYQLPGSIVCTPCSFGRLHSTLIFFFLLYFSEAHFPFPFVTRLTWTQILFLFPSSTIFSFNFIAFLTNWISHQFLAQQSQREKGCSWALQAHKKPLQNSWAPATRRPLNTKVADWASQCSFPCFRSFNSAGKELGTEHGAKLCALPLQWHYRTRRTRAFIIRSAEHLSRKSL